MGSTNAPLLVEADNKVVTITINRPEDKNGLNWEALELLSEAYQQVIDNDRFCAVVVTGNNEYFHTGGRVDVTNREEQKRYTAAVERMQQLQDQLTVPLIAAVSGDCLKGGMGFLADADLAVARKGVRFGFPEVRMGGVPMMVLASAIHLPKKRLLEACYSSEYFTAETALEMGLVNAVVPNEEFWPTVRRYVQMVSEKPKELIRMTRAAYQVMSELPQKQDRIEYAMKTLRNQVLKTMSAGETEYSV